MNVLTTTMCYPAPEQPDRGVFVYRRTAALARRLDLRVVSPQPWCPVLRRNPPQYHETSRDNAFQPGSGLLPVRYPRMFSIPVLGWATDGLAYARALQKDISQFGAVDLIDAHFEYPDGVGAYLAARRLGIPVVVTLRGKLVSLSAKLCRCAQIRAMLLGADGLIAVSASLAALARKIAGRNLDIAVIPNGVDSSVFHPLDKTAARASLGWRNDRRYVLCVGHYQHLKGFDRLAAIWPVVRAAANDACLVLVGSRRGERGHYERIQRTVTAGGMRECVSLLDPVDSTTLNLMYNAADVSVNASRSEGWCNTISESLACGTPVVATDVGGNREQLNSPELGIVVPDGDLQALSETILTALARPWDQPLIAARGRIRNWDQVAAEVVEVFHHAAARAAVSQDMTAPRGSGRLAHLVGGGHPARLPDRAIPPAPGGAS
jgi:teichuronic acid biosynthesis glycosyltransferase TuaC